MKVMTPVDMCVFDQIYNGEFIRLRLSDGTEFTVTEENADNGTVLRVRLESMQVMAVAPQSASEVLLLDVTP